MSALPSRRKLVKARPPTSAFCASPPPFPSSPTMASTIKSVKSIVPLLDRVLVQRFKAEAKTASGLYLPSSATKSPLPEATVVAAGPGALTKTGQTVPMSVKAGDKVLLPGWGGSSIKVGDEVRIPPLLRSASYSNHVACTGVPPHQGQRNPGQTQRVIREMTY